MTLNASRLRLEFAMWVRNSQEIATYLQAERLFALTYHHYAKKATDVSGEYAINLSYRKFQMQLDFQSSRTPEQFCRQLDRAFVAYWTGVTFATAIVPPVLPPCPNQGGNGVFASEVSSVVVGVSPQVLYAELLPVVSSLSTAEGVATHEIASAFDRATKQAVDVLISGWDTTPGPTGPLPITNLCGVF